MRLTAREAFDGLYLFDGDGDDLDKLWVRVAAEVDPRLFVTAAITSYRKNGDDRKLRIASDLLSRLGEGAIPVLRELARSGDDGELFVDAVVSIDVSEKDRRDLLLMFLSSSSRDVMLKTAEVMNSLGYTVPMLSGSSTIEIPVGPRGSDRLGIDP